MSTSMATHLEHVQDNDGDERRYGSSVASGDYLPEFEFLTEDESYDDEDLHERDDDSSSSWSEEELRHLQVMCSRYYDWLGGTDADDDDDGAATKTPSVAEAFYNLGRLIQSSPPSGQLLPTSCAAPDCHNLILLTSPPPSPSADHDNELLHNLRRRLWCSRNHYLQWLECFYSLLLPDQVCRFPGCLRHVFVSRRRRRPLYFCSWLHHQKYHMLLGLQSRRRRHRPLLSTMHEHMPMAAAAAAAAAHTSYPNGRLPNRDEYPRNIENYSIDNAARYYSPSAFRQRVAHNTTGSVGREANGGGGGSCVIIEILRDYVAGDTSKLPRHIRIEDDFFQKHPWEVLSGQTGEQSCCVAIAKCRWKLATTGGGRKTRELVTKEGYHWKQQGKPILIVSSAATEDADSGFDCHGYRESQLMNNSWSRSAAAAADGYGVVVCDGAAACSINVTRRYLTYCPLGRQQRHNCRTATTKTRKRKTATPTGVPETTLPPIRSGRHKRDDRSSDIDDDNGAGSTENQYNASIQHRRHYHLQLHGAADAVDAAITAPEICRARRSSNSFYLVEYTVSGNVDGGLSGSSSCHGNTNVNGRNHEKLLQDYCVVKLSRRPPKICSRTTRSPSSSISISPSPTPHCTSSLFPLPPPPDDVSSWQMPLDPFAAVVAAGNSHDLHDVAQYRLPDLILDDDIISDELLSLID